MNDLHCMNDLHGMNDLQGMHDLHGIKQSCKKWSNVPRADLSHLNVPIDYVLTWTFIKESCLFKSCRMNFR
jgi:hypothetical protein